MNTATLPQSVRILSAFAEKNLNTEQTQNVLGSGIFTDLLEAARLGLLRPENRNEISKLLGLSHWDVWQVVTVGGKKKQQIVEEIAAARLPIDDSVRFVLSQDYFPCSSQIQKVKLVRVKAGIFCDEKTPKPGNLSWVRGRAKDRGLKDCPIETAFELYLKSTDYQFAYPPLVVSGAEFSTCQGGSEGLILQIEKSVPGPCEGRLKAIKLGSYDYIDPDMELIFALAQ